MMDLPTVAVAGALTVTGVALALTATWRRYVRPWWTTLEWRPRITPGIKAEVILVMGDDDEVSCYYEKFPPEADLTRIFAALSVKWFQVGESLGVSLNWSSKVGAVIDTPDGPEYLVALCRPQARPDMRDMTAEELAHPLLADAPTPRP